MKFEDFHDIEKELVVQINVRDKDKLNKEKSFEVEHLYVDFKYLIIGEKIRNLTDLKETEEFNIPRFDDLYYAIFFLKSGDNNYNFYLQESVQKIIEFQFVETKRIMGFIFHLFAWMYGIPISILLFTKEESIHQKMLNIALVPTVLLFLVEVIEMKYRGMDYLKPKKVIDIGQALLFWTLQILNRSGIADTAPFMPFINLALILASCLKLLYYMRIFEQYGFLIQMILFCLADLVPFIISFAVFNLIFIICFAVIGMEIDPEVDEAPFDSYIMKTALQAFRTTYGELAMPVYWHLLKLKDPNCPYVEQNITDPNVEPNPGACEWETTDDLFKNLKIAVIWVLWFGQTFWMLVMMLNFLIGVINASYGRAMTFQEVIRYRHKAELNEECCIYKSFFYQYPEYKTIVFSTSKAIDQSAKDRSLEIMSAVQKYIGGNHKDRRAEENKSVNDLAKCIDLQEEIKNKFKEKFEYMLEKHGTIESKVNKMLTLRR